MIIFAAAAGVINILNSRIIPTDCSEPIIDKAKTFKKILFSNEVFKPDTLAPTGSKDKNKNCLWKKSNVSITIKVKIEVIKTSKFDTPKI